MSPMRWITPLRLSRATAALLLATLTAPIGAQTVTITRVPSPDSDGATLVRIVGADVDSLNALLRTYQRERYGSAAWLEAMRQFDRLLTRDAPRIRARQQLSRTAADPESTLDAMPAGWIGILSQGPTLQQLDDDGLRVTYFAYPSIISVDPRSPAERAGIAPGDKLVAYNGIDVVGREFNLTKLLVPDSRIELTVRRDGVKKDYAIEVAKAPEGVFKRRVAFDHVPEPQVMIALPRHPAETVGATPSPMVASGVLISARGAFGASLSPVGPGLAKALKLEQGLLVNEVPREAPAYASGLRAGDVIVSAAGRPVSTLDELQNLVVAHLGDRALALQIVRDHGARRVTVRW
jgi:hypothetical protein